MGINVPIVVPSAGTEWRAGKSLLTGTNLIPAETMQEAAEDCRKGCHGRDRRALRSRECNTEVQRLQWAALVDRDTRVLIQGLTGREGQFRSGQMINTAPKSWPASHPEKAAPRRSVCRSSIG